MCEFYLVVILHFCIILLLLL